MKNEKYTHPLKTVFGSTNLADMQLISKHNKAFRVLLCFVVDIHGKYVWVVPLKDEKSITIIHAFDKILNESCNLK